MKDTCIIWGYGLTATDCMEKYVLTSDFEILAFVDNNVNIWGEKFYGYSVMAPEKGMSFNPDYVLVLVDDNYEEVILQLKNDLGYNIENVLTFKSLEEKLVNKLVLKYGKTDDEEIKTIINNYVNKGFNMYGNFYPDYTYEPVYFEDSHPYILFYGKKMYYPDSYNKFKYINSKVFAGNYEYEQKKHSPHLYVDDINKIKSGMVMIDAGVGEGNFSLKYVDEVKKLYLIEPDTNWMEALERTFFPYKEKVIFCDKFLDKQTTASSTCLDDLVNESVDFIKMDIEGYEINALLGAKKTLTNSNVNCAICSYHKKSDEENIRFILENLGYRTSVSEGKMFFVYDSDIVTTMDFRHGIVYASRCN